MRSVGVSKILHFSRALHNSFCCGGVGYQNCGISPQNTHCAISPTYGGGTPISRMDLESSYVPVGWQVAHFGILGRRGTCLGLEGGIFLGLERGRPGTSRRYTSLGRPESGHSIDLLESGLMAKIFR